MEKAISNFGLVSIIIPIYNVSEYLDECVKSACCQTYSNIEIILVDDGSTDDSHEKCDEWAKQDSRIFVVHKENGGLSSARNAGLDVASGKYTYFLDGDDYISPKLLETVLPYMDEDADMVAFHYSVNNPDGKIAHKHKLGLFQLHTDKERIEFACSTILRGEIGWEAWSRIYKKDIIDKYGLRFADNRRIFAEDLYFCLCYCAYAKKIYSINSKLYIYRDRCDSIMGTDRKKLNIGRFNELSKEVLTFYKKNDLVQFISHFQIIHFLILVHALECIQKVYSASIIDLYNDIVNDISDISFFKKYILIKHKDKEILYSRFSVSKVEEIINIFNYISNGRKFTLRLKNYMLYKFADKLDERNPYEKQIEKRYRDFSKNEKCIYLLGMEIYGNLGDHKINESELIFFKRYFPKYCVMHISNEEYWKNKAYLKKYIKDSDLIFLSGGGNFGNEYVDVQMVREDVVTTWRNNLKIVFPQTIYFTKTKSGVDGLKKDEQIFIKDNNVILFARDDKSFEFVKEHFSCEVHKAPDIVLMLNHQNNIKRDNYVLLCLRNDIEKNLTEKGSEILLDAVNSKNYKVIYTDLQLDYHVTEEQAVDLLENRFNQFQQAKLVITDRLHGMIFSAITATPCVVLNNYNHKLAETYKWLKYLPYIKFAKDIDTAILLANELINLPNQNYDQNILAEHFDKMADIIKSAAGKSKIKFTETVKSKIG